MILSYMPVAFSRVNILGAFDKDSRYRGIVNSGAGVRGCETQDAAYEAPMHSLTQPDSLGPRLVGAVRATLLNSYARCLTATRVPKIKV